MAGFYVITSPCIGVKDASCIDVCPVFCIHTTTEASQYYIDPMACIDCGSCELVCPVQAIYYMDDVPSDQQEFIQKNAEFFCQHEIEDPHY